MADTRTVTVRGTGHASTLTPPARAEANRAAASGLPAMELVLRCCRARALCVLLDAGAARTVAAPPALVSNTRPVPSRTQAIYIYRLDTFQLDSIIAGFEKTITGLCW